MASDASSPQTHASDGACTSFLHLPFEIRRQIYFDVLADHPKLERELPGYPARRTPKHVTAPISLPGSAAAKRYKPLPSSRPLGYIPASLLLACRQIYLEARAVPFEENEFVFTEWMTTATSYCDAATRSMAAWQREALRHARFAMGLHELCDVPANERGHRPACHGPRLAGVLASRLPAVRTLRVDLTSGVFPTPWFERKGEGYEEVVAMKEDWTGGRKWIDEGLRRMPALRVVEVECSFLVWMTPSRVSAEDKRRCEEELAVEWCAKVEEILNEGREEGERTRVVAVTKPREGDGLGSARCRSASVEDALTLSFMPSGLGNYV